MRLLYSCKAFKIKNPYFPKLCCCYFAFKAIYITYDLVVPYPGFPKVMFNFIQNQMILNIFY